MTAMLQKAEFLAPRGTAQGVSSFQELACLVQRTLDCDAVVLSVDHFPESPSLPRRRGGACTQSIAVAFREGKVERNCPDPIRLTHPVGAGDQGMRFYAGLPLRDRCGQPIGMLAAVDRAERQLGAAGLDSLRHFAGMAADIDALRRIGLAA